MDTTFLILFPATALCLLLVAGLTVRSYRLCSLSKRQGKAPETNGHPPVSVVVTCRDQLADLQQNLPRLLTQDYPAGYEVIVVDMGSTDDTEEWLKQMEEQCPRLLCSRCPESARDISLRRLALTLGLRAAACEWVVLLQADTHIPDSRWLHHLTGACTDHVDAVVPIVRYTPEKGLQAEYRQFHTLWKQMLWLPHALSHVPYRTEESCLCYRKSHFFAHKGFASNTVLEDGALTLLVNHNIHAGRCHVNALPQAIVESPMPSVRSWATEQLYFMETRQHLRATTAYRTEQLLSMTLHLLTPLLLAVLTFLPQPCRWAVPMMWLLWLCIAIAEQMTFNATARQLQTPAVRQPVWMLVCRTALDDLHSWCSWRATDRRIFRKRFI